MAVLDWLQQILGGGDPEAQGAAQASTAMQPMTQQWLDKVLSGEMARSGIQDVNDAFASRDPVALAGSFGPSPLGIRAFHGSPHSFDRFDLSKIGTGEGAQAYGHGLYFAESEPVARSYRDALSAPLMDPINNVKDLMLNKGWSKQQVVDHFNMMINTGRTPQHEGFYRDAIDAANSGSWKDYTPPKGHMYEVDINAKPEDFLNWDKPLAAQPAGRLLEQEPFKSLAAADQAKVAEARASVGLEGAGSGITGEKLYDLLRSNPNPGGSRFNVEGSREASDVLAKAGIPGVQYLDQGSRAAGEGSHNYAIWTPEIITILRRYGLLPPLAAGGGLLATQPGSE